MSRQRNFDQAIARAMKSASTGIENAIVYARGLDPALTAKDEAALRRAVELLRSLAERAERKGRQKKRTEEELQARIKTETAHVAQRLTPVLTKPEDRFAFIVSVRGYPPPPDLFIGARAQWEARYFMETELKAALDSVAYRLATSATSGGVDTIDTILAKLPTAIAKIKDRHALLIDLFNAALSTDDAAPR